MKNVFKLYFYFILTILTFFCLPIFLFSELETIEEIKKSYRMAKDWESWYNECFKKERDQ